MNKYPSSNPEYGTVIEEHFVERGNSVKRIALIEKGGKRYLCFQQMYRDKTTEEWKHGKAIWLCTDNGVAAECLAVAAGFLTKSEQGEQDATL